VQTILKPYLNTEIGINYLKPYHVDPATLAAVAEDHFSVRSPEDGAVYTYPYSNVVRIIEREGGVSVGSLFTHRKSYSVVVKVGHMIDVAPMI
jgi:hypothetical protein